MNSLYKINNTDKETAMLMFISNLECRGIPMVLFVARLRGSEVQCNQTVLQHIDTAILWAGGKHVWLNFLNQCAVDMGAASEF